MKSSGSEVAVVFTGDETRNFKHNAEKAMKPASLTKIVTAAYSLEKLPMNFKWKSQLRTSSKVRNDKLMGDLCYYGGGNPNFLTEQLWVLVNHFRRSGIKTISGDLVVDESFFDREYFDDKRMKKRVLRAYDSPVGGASFNWNSVNLYIRPGKTIGQKAKVFVDPENDYVQIDNQLTTSSGKSYVDIKRVNKNGVEIFKLKGRVSIHADEKVYYRPIQKPSLWTGHNLIKNLKLLGIKLSGKLKTGRCKTGAKVLASVDSKDLSLVIRDLMKYSNNFIAEVLAKTLVRHELKKQGNMDDSLGLLSKYLKSLGSTNHELYSVSGLSYHNRMSANSISKVLERMKRNFSVSSEFETSLPIGGVDGTLKSRFKHQMTSKLRAKTGLLNSVVGLAGYGLSNRNKPFQFVLIYNGTGKMESWKIRNLFDKMVADYAKNN